MGIPPCRLFLLGENVAQEDEKVMELLIKAGLFPTITVPTLQARAERRMQREA
jgi:hypothetical protein